MLAIYNLTEAANSRISDLEVIAQEPWRIASRQRSSTTREYLGAVRNIEALREGNGEFDTEQAFYDFWRAYPFRIGRAAQRILDQLLNER